MNSLTDKESKARIMKEMLDPKSDLRLLYVTPEKCRCVPVYLTIPDMSPQQE